MAGSEEAKVRCLTPFQHVPGTIQADLTRLLAALSAGGVGFQPSIHLLLCRRTRLPSMANWLGFSPRWRIMGRTIRRLTATTHARRLRLR